MKRKYPIITKTCPVCNNKFEASKGSPREKKTCSYSCSNTYFRSGDNNGMRSKSKNYRTTCFLHHKKECIICGESNIVAVHHYDNDHTNNDPSNLIPLCPTHHAYVHSDFNYLVKEQIDIYQSTIQPSSNISSKES